MKILHINASDIGSTGKIVDSICKKAKMNGMDSVFIFPRQNKKNYKYAKAYSVSLKYEQGLYRRIYYLQGLHYGFAPFSTRKILQILRVEKPDVVHLHCINCGIVNIYKLLYFLKKDRIPTVVTNHAEFYYTGNCPHAFECDKWTKGCGNCPDLYKATDSRLFDRTSYAWKKMKESFRGFENIKIVSVSPWVYERSKASPILCDLSQEIVFNGVDVDLFRVKDSKDVYKKLGFSNKYKVILHVTANFSDVDTSTKGGKYIVDLANELKHENVIILVIGTHQIRGEIPENIYFLGPIYDQELLAKYYSGADLCIMTSKRETFGMTLVESLCCGTPVVGFKAGGPESIALSLYTEFVDFGDVKALKRIIKEKWLNYKTEESAMEISNKAMCVYSEDNMSTKYCEIYKALHDEKRKGKKCK